MHDGTCDTCFYYLAFPNRPSVQGLKGKGSCLRYPPTTYVAAEKVSVPPIVYGNGVCGEWRAVENTEMKGGA